MRYQWTNNLSKPIHNMMLGEDPRQDIPVLVCYVLLSLTERSQTRERETICPKEEIVACMESNRNTCKHWQVSRLP